uniref:Uncharacterized protein n=1 Tax=Cacopsylla melanoneura TaxID=428564 RepID=A0A8D8Y7W9_9HEMI
MDKPLIVSTIIIITSCVLTLLFLNVKHDGSQYSMPFIVACQCRQRRIQKFSTICNINKLTMQKLMKIPTRFANSFGADFVPKFANLDKILLARKLILLISHFVDLFPLLLICSCFSMLTNHHTLNCILHSYLGLTELFSKK